MHTPRLLIVASLLLCASAIHAQNRVKENATDPIDIFNVGFGFGQDYGGIGANITYYPQKNVSLFGGFGYAIAGFGYNAGVKLRLLPKQGEGSVRPFIEAMYGYNGAVAITDASQYNKLFYGPTVGVGLDIVTGRARRGFISAALLIPIRNSDAQDYIDQLRAMGAYFPHDLAPVTFSIGYKFMIN